MNQELYHVVDTATSVCNTYHAEFLLLLDTLREMQAALKQGGRWEKHKKSFATYYASQVYFLINYGIRFDKDDFIKNVRWKCRYKKFRIARAGAGSGGIKAWIDVMLFNTDIRLYVKVKKLRKAWRRRKQMRQNE